MVSVDTLDEFCNAARYLDKVKARMGLQLCTEYPINQRVNDQVLFEQLAYVAHRPIEDISTSRTNRCRQFIYNGVRFFNYGRYE